MRIIINHLNNFTASLIKYLNYFDFAVVTFHSR
jgi:hypothetical protein